MLKARKIPSAGKKTGMARPVIDAERCKGCGICTAFCPEKILVLGDQLNANGYPFVTMVDAEACRGCRICYLMCPDVVFAFLQEENEPCKS